MSEFDENIKVDLKKFKGHYRKFPWALIIRVIVACISIGIIFVMVKSVAELKEKKQKDKERDEIQIEYQSQ